MKRLLFFALVVFAAWYGYHHYRELKQEGASQLIAINHTGRQIERLRIIIGDQTEVVEILANGATVKRPYRFDHDGSFHLTWQLTGIMGEKSWDGGNFSHGPIILAHTFDFREGDGVIYSTERIASK